MYQHGGTSNAATSEDYTTYYFSIQNECFDKALDMFSQFFKSPLFTESATEREMNAVDNEFKMRLSDDNRRLNQIEKELALPNHPLKHFSTGNLQTLNKPNIHKLLLEYYESHYSANLMSLCLVANYSLDQLEDLAIT